MLSARPPVERQILVLGHPRPNGSSKLVNAAVVGGLLAGPAGAALAWAGKAAYDSLTRKGAAPRSLCVATATAGDLDGLKFPPGHPASGCAYALNPVKPDTYIPFHQYHRVVLREKVAELFALLAALRAERVQVEVGRGTLRSGAAQLGAFIPAQVPVQVKLGGGAQTSSSHVTRFEARFEGSGAPHRPEWLRWFDHEPEWQALARARLEQGMRSFTVGLQYLDTAGITAQVGVELEGQGYSLGGEFQAHQAEEWQFSGTFAKKPLLGW